jgi:hypothetical protein
MSEELLYWQALNRAMDAELAADCVGVHAR